MKEKSVLLFFALLSTILLIYFSIPNFLEKEKINALLEKLNFSSEKNENNSGGKVDFEEDDKKDNENNNDDSQKENEENNNNNDDQKENENNNNNDNDQKEDEENNNNNNDQKEDEDNNDDQKENGDNNNNDNDQKEDDENNNDNEEDNPSKEEPDNKPEDPIPSKTTFHAYFNVNGADGITPASVSCETTGNSCTVTLPKLETTREFLGWSLNKNSTSPTLTAGSKVTLSTNRTYYAITRKNYTVTIMGNGSFIGSQKKVCSIYNTNSTCQVTLPDLNRDFYTSWGYNSNPNSASIDYGINTTLNVNSDQTLYAIRKIETSDYDKYANVALDVFNKINSLRTSKGLSALNYSKSLELSAMLRLSEIAQDYNYTVNGDRHIRISNNEPFYTVNEFAYGENYFRGYGCDATYFHDSFVASSSHLENMLSTDVNIAGISVGVKGGQCYIVELFGIQ